MPLIGFVVAILVAILFLYLISLIPGVDPQLLQLLRVVIVICLVLYLLFGFAGLIGTGWHPCR